MPHPTMTSNVALKEWAVVIDALAQGTQTILLRKGGIRDPKGAFQLQHREFLLYPTWEHQGEEPQAIRSEFQGRLKELCEAARHPAEVLFDVAAGVAFCAEIREGKQLSGLEKYHIYTPGFFLQRMIYRPQAPTLLVVLRAYRLPKPVIHPVQPQEAGCKSWVPLDSAIPIGNVTPVMDNRQFRKTLEEISAQLA